MISRLCLRYSEKFSVSNNESKSIRFCITTSDAIFHKRFLSTKLKAYPPQKFNSPLPLNIKRLNQVVTRPLFSLVCLATQISYIPAFEYNIFAKIKSCVKLDDVRRMLNAFKGKG